MPLPESWTQVPITGTFLRANGLPNRGTIAFKRGQIVDLDGSLIAATQFLVQLDANGSIPADFTLPATDDPDLPLRGWAYTVYEYMAEGREPYMIAVPYDAGTINLVTAPHTDGIGNAQSPFVRKVDIGVTVASVESVEAAAADAASALALGQESFGAINDRIDDMQLTLQSGMIGFETKAEMDADLNHPDQTLALVTNDATAANNIVYRKSGASGAGLWEASIDRVAVIEAAVEETEAYEDNLNSYTFELQSPKNLYNPAAQRADIFLNSSSGALGAAVGWAVSDFIPVVAGQQYTISASDNKRVGAAFYSTDNPAGTGYIPGSYDGSVVNASTTVTLTAPVGAQYLVMNVKSNTTAEPAQVQVEHAAVATAFEAWFEPFRAVKSSAIVGTLAEGVVNGRLDDLEERVDLIEPVIPVDFIKNHLPNGDMEFLPSWTYTGSSPIVDVSAVPELADLGIAKAYSIPDTGGTASQARVNTGLLDSVGAVGGENLLVGCLVYASNGVAFPASWASFTVKVDGVLSGFTETGYVQVSTNVRFLWAKKAVAAGDLSEVIIGFTSGNLPAASGVTRYHTGFYMHHSAAAIDSPTPINIERYFAWNGAGTAADLFETLRDVAADYEAGQLGASSALSRLVLAGDGDGNSYIEAVRGGVTVKREFNAFPLTSMIAASIFALRVDTVNGTVVKSASDDMAPYRVFGDTVGAGHGYSLTSATAAAHGKTQADVGSVWSKAGVQHVLVGIKDANTLYVVLRSSNSAVTAGTLTHVSGATHTTDIVITAVAALQWYPPFKNRVCRCFVDGVEVTDHEAATVFAKNVVFAESYDVMDREDIVEWFVANIGTTEIVADADAAFSVSLAHEFDKDGNYTLYADFVVRKAGVSLQDIMFLQAQRITVAGDGAIQYYIPKALPFTHQGIDYDFANIDSSDTSGWGGVRADLTPDRCEPTGILCDRVVQLSNSFGYAIGFAPVQDAGVTERRVNATVKALQLSDSSGKIYMACIDAGTQVLGVGDAFSAIGYRNLLVNDPSRTCSYPVRTRGACFLYADWHAAGMDSVPVPDDFAGREFSVVEKSANVTLLSKSMTNMLSVSIADSDPAYLILKVE